MGPKNNDKRMAPLSVEKWEAMAFICPQRKRTPSAIWTAPAKPAKRAATALSNHLRPGSLATSYATQ